jgi:hypothetical protein
MKPTPKLLAFLIGSLMLAANVSAQICDNNTKPWTVRALRDRVTLPRHVAANGYRTLTTGIIHRDFGMPKDDFQIIGPVPGQRNKRDARGHWDFGPQAYDETLFLNHAT